MKNGKEYCLHIRQQIADLIEQTHSNVHERVTLDKLDFGMNKQSNSNLDFDFLFRTSITEFIGRI